MFLARFAHVQRVRFLGHFVKLAHAQFKPPHPLKNGKFLLKFGLSGKTHKIGKNLPHVFDKSGDLLSKRQNHEEDFFKLCVLLRKSELYHDLLN